MNSCQNIPDADSVDSKCREYELLIRRLVEVGLDLSLSRMRVGAENCAKQSGLTGTTKPNGYITE